MVNTTANEAGATSHSKSEKGFSQQTVALTDQEVHPRIVHSNILSIVIADHFCRHKPMLQSFFEELSIVFRSTLGVKREKLLEQSLVFKEGKDGNIGVMLFLTLRK